MALHRYWMWANRLRDYFDSALVSPSWLERLKNFTDSNPFAFGIAFFADEPGMFMSHWYGALYVVIEGWQELELQDPEINKLLEHSNVGLLRRYRNGSFHYQKDYFDDRFEGFMAEKDSVEWVRTLNKAFGRYFLDYISKNKAEQGAAANP